MCAVLPTGASLKEAEIMQILLNGAPQTVEEGLSLKKLVESLGSDPRGIAIELNREIIPKSEHGEVILKDGDTLEVVQFVGGG